MSAHYTDAILSLLKEADIQAITPRILPMNQKSRIATIVVIAPFRLSLSSAIRIIGTIIIKKHAKVLAGQFQVASLPPIPH